MSTLRQFLAPLQTEIKNQQRQIRVDLRGNEWKEPQRHKGHKDRSLLYKLNLGTCVGIISQPENHSVEESDQPDGILSKRKSLSCGGSRRLSPYLG